MGTTTWYLVTNIYCEYTYVYLQFCFQVPVATVDMIKNLSETTLKNIRKEGCFINKMLPDGVTASCTAMQDEHVFKCPFNMLRNVRDIRKDNQKLYSETSRRCACGHPTCDIDSITVKNSLTQMGLQVNVIIHVNVCVYVCIVFDVFMFAN